MAQRFKNGIYLAALAVLAMPKSATCQFYEVPPVPFTGPLSEPRYLAPDPLRVFRQNGKGVVHETQMGRTDDRVSFGYVSWWGDVSAPVAGVSSMWYLGSTSAGSFTASVDTHVSLRAIGPALGLEWYPCEALWVYFRWAPLRGGVWAATLHNSD